MGRKSKVLLTTLGLVSLLGAASAGTAFAAASVNAGNTTVAAELVPAAGVFNIPLVNTAYNTGGAVAVSSQIKISLSGGSFTALSNVALCNGLALAAGLVGTAAVGAAPNNASVTITTLLPLVASATLNLQPAAVCAAGTVALTNVNVNAGATAGTNVTITVDNALNPGDTSIFATDTLAQVKNQFKVTLKKVNSQIAFASNQQIFVVDAPLSAAPPRTNSTTTSQAGIQIDSDESLGNKIVVTGVAACADTLAAANGLNLELTGDFSGITSIEYGAAGGPVTTINITPAMVTNNKAVLPIPGNQLLICRPLTTNNTAAVVQLTAKGPSGTVSLATGWFMTKLSLGGTAGTTFGAGNVNDLLPVTESHSLKLTATTFFIPLIKYDPANGVDTFIKISSSSSLPGANGLSGSILTDDGSYAKCTFTAIMPGTPSVISGMDWDACVTAAGKTANLVAGQIGKVIVNVPQANVQALANLAQLGQVQRVPMQILGAARGE